MNFLETISESQEIISLPTVASQVITILEDENVHLKELSSLIEKDAAISMKLLRFANSPMYGLRNPVSSIMQAVSTVGVNRVMNIVLGVSIFSKFHFLSNMEHADFIKKFWGHSATTAGIARAIGVKLKKSFGDNEFVGGLIHDVGKLSMIQYDTSKYVDVLSLMKNEGINDSDAETEVFGATHVQAGAIISEKWQLPTSLQHIVAHHDHPENANEDTAVASLVRLADIVCEKNGFGVGEIVEGNSLAEDVSWKNLCSLYPDLKSTDVDKLCTELDEDFSKATSFLNTVLS